MTGGPVPGTRVSTSGVCTRVLAMRSHPGAIDSGETLAQYYLAFQRFTKPQIHQKLPFMP